MRQQRNVEGQAATWHISNYLKVGASSIKYLSRHVLR